MLVVDSLLIAVVLISVVIGVIRGFFKEALSLVTWLIAIWVAWKYSALTEPLLGGLLAQPEVRLWTGRVLLFLMVLLVGGLLSWFVSTLVQRTGLGGTDRVLGMAFGFGRGLLVLGLLIIVGQVLQMTQEPWWDKSRVIPYGERVAEHIEGLLETGAEYVMESTEELAKANGR